MKLSGIAKKMVWVIAALSLVCMIAGVIYYRSLSALPFVLGVLLGAGVNVVKILLLERAVARAVDMEEKSGANYIRVQYFLRFLFTGAALALAAIAPDHILSLWGAVAGIFTFPIAAHSLRFFVKPDKIPGGQAADTAETPPADHEFE